MAQPSIKVTVVGDGHVGKTCMLFVYAKKEYPSRYIPTVFDNYSDNIEVDNVEYQLTIWDTAGQEDYERLRPLSYPNTNCFLICYSIASKDSYENVKSKWAPEVRHHIPQATLLLVGTKGDLRQEDDPNLKLIDPSQGNAMKKMIKASGYFECSAKQNFGINEIFEAAVRQTTRNTVKTKKRVCAIL